MASPKRTDAENSLEKHLSLRLHSSTVCVVVPDMIFYLPVRETRRGLCVIGIAARHEATLMVFVFGVLVILAAREADIVLFAS